MHHSYEHLRTPSLIGVPLVSLHPLQGPPPKAGHKYRPFYTSQTLEPIPFSLTSPLPASKSLGNIFLGESPGASGGIDDSPTSMALHRRILRDDYLLAEMDFAEEIQQAGIGCMANPQFQNEGTTDPGSPFMTEEGVAGGGVVDPAAFFATEGKSSFHGAFEANEHLLLAIGAAITCGMTLGTVTLESGNQAQAETEGKGRPFDDRFFSQCHVYHHDPQRPLPTTKEVLMRLGTFLGPGITKTEFRQLLRKCKSCHRFMYADSRAYHRCLSAPLKDVNEPTFDLVSAFLSLVEHCGWARSDILRLLRICNRCDRIVLGAQLALHICP